MSRIVRPILCAFDSSHLGKIVADKHSSDSSRRNKAFVFLDSLLESGSVLLLCWHHLEELLKHRNERVVADRFSFLHDLPLIAWIRDYTGTGTIGSILDIFSTEVATAYEYPDANVIEVRDRVAKSLISYGPGAEAMAPYSNIWQKLQEELWSREERTREIVAISSSKLVDISNTKLDTWLKGTARTQEEADLRLEILSQRLTTDINSHGDKRIPDSKSVAQSFIDEVNQEGRVMLADDQNPLLNYLLQKDIDLSDLRPGITMAQVFEIMEFRGKLRVANQNLCLEWPDLKSRVQMDRIPSCLIQNQFVRHRPDQNRHKGSELVDKYLACLSPYADVTYVDKQTNEIFRRAKMRCHELSALVRRVKKASGYSDILPQN